MFCVVFSQNQHHAIGINRAELFHWRCGICVAYTVDRWQNEKNLPKAFKIIAAQTHGIHCSF